MNQCSCVSVSPDLLPHGVLRLIRYQAQLEALYTALEERQKERLRALREGTCGSVSERVQQVDCSPFTQAEEA